MNRPIKRRKQEKPDSAGLDWANAEGEMSCETFDAFKSNDGNLYRQTSYVDLKAWYWSHFGFSFHHNDS